MTTESTILVCGATGRQGGAVARCLLADGWQVRALTRNPGSAAARQLEQAGADIVAGDLNDQESLFRILDGVYGVFGVTDFWEHGYAGELRMGRNLVNAAVQTGIQRFVFSSVGGTDRTEKLRIRHFDAKREIEQHLQSTGIRWSILRPVTFFENFSSARFRHNIVERGVLHFAILPSKPFQMVAMHDVGVFATKAFQGHPALDRQAVELASDDLTMLDLAESLSRAVGHHVRYRYLPPLAQHLIAGWVEFRRQCGYYKVGHTLVAQFRWNNRSPHGGWQADIDALRAVHPGLLTMDQWVQSIEWRADLTRRETSRNSMA